VEVLNTETSNETPPARNSEKIAIMVDALRQPAPFLQSSVFKEAYYLCCYFCEFCGKELE
jgi:hypothetical protein